MATVCGCGLNELPAGAGCRECGTACCESCALKIDAEAYCRWCALSLPPALAA
jgi:hypothetical protein